MMVAIGYLRRTGKLLSSDFHKEMGDGTVVEARYGELLESMPDGIIIVDKAGRIVLANHQAERLFGYDRGELRGKSLETLLPQRFRRSHAGHRAQYDSQPHRRALGAAPVDLYGQRKDGVEFPVDISLSPLETQDGTLTVSSIRDITERKRAEQALQEKNLELGKRTSELHAANQELEAFTHSISHDLRAPLRAIGGFSKMLLQDHGPHLPAEGQRLLNVVCSSADQMRQMIDNLLKFSRLGRQALSIQSVNVSGLVHEVIEELRKEEKAGTVQVQVSDLPPCQADPALLKQVFVNLLSNAVKFTSSRENPRVEVGHRIQDEAKVYFVSDNGVGFDMRYADKLFGVFQRLHDEEQFEGTGVGLSIVQRIIHRHGGKVWADAEEGKGATFYFTLAE
jgi:PAS domain S-box-containing protein